MTEVDDALTIVVPTIGRPSLRNTLDSIACQLQMFDQVFVVADGNYPASNTLVQQYGIQYGYFELANGPHNDWGARARNFGIDLAKKAYIAFMDDDDHYLPGAFEFIKNAIQMSPGNPFMFRMIHGKNIIWTRNELALGNVSSQMVVVPNDRKKLGRFTDRYEGDYDFIKQTADLYSTDYDPFIWREEIISILFKANGKPYESPIPTLELPTDFRDLHSD
jgi:glycosyltransferase involved in cell wall biosynthesis